MKRRISACGGAAPEAASTWRRALEHLGALTVLAAALLCGAGVAKADSRSFSSSYTTNTIPGTGNSGVAQTYPVPLDVSVPAGQVVQGMTVKLTSLSHTFPDDLDILLVAPNGQSATLMSDAGGSVDLNEVDLTFDDAAPNSLPDNTQITTGTYKPTDLTSGDTYPYPAPSSPGPASLATFNGINPNGTWRLFIVDDTADDTGTLYGGFTLNFKLGYANTTAINIPATGSANDTGISNPYPSAINVSGVEGTVSKVTASFTNLSHAGPGDIDAVLVSPGGQSVRLMSDAGGLSDISNVNLTFDDAASASLPQGTSISSGTYKPTNYGADNDALPAATVPANNPPAPPYADLLSAFNGGNPNGVWKLYINDDANSDAGSLGSWSLNIEVTPPTIAFSTTAFTAAEGTSPLVTINRSSANGTSTVYVTAFLGTTASSNDYSFISGTVTFADGESSKAKYLDIQKDGIDEPDEKVVLILTNATGATVGNPGVQTVTITDIDPPPTLSLSGASASEGAGSLRFPYTLSQRSEKPISFDVAVTGGTATPGADFTAPATTVNIPAGTTSGFITVPITQDALDEADETILLSVSNAMNVTTLLPTTATGVIVDDDDAPSLSISDATVTEGNSGTASAAFTVTLSAASAQPISVDYATSDGSASAPSDYASTSGTLSFAPGQTSKTITVPVNGDVLIEGDETFNVTLSSPVSATVSDGAGVGTITNDDSAQSLPVVSVGAARVSEGSSGTSSAAFAVSLSSSPSQPVTVSYATADGTAQAGSDYVSTSGTLTFAPGVTSQAIAVPVLGDTAVEPDETFTLNLSGAVNAVIGAASGVGTIANDDAATPPPSLVLFTPANGVRTTLVTIVGSGFAGATSVRFNGVAAAFSVASPNSIQARVPLTATTGKITVTTPVGTLASKTSFTVYVPPTVAAFAPASGPVGTAVTVRGTNFSNVSSVRLGSFPVRFTVVNPTTLRFTVPLGASSNKVTVVTVGGVGTSGATFRVAPSITRLSPDRGAVGTTVLIDGSNLLGTTIVRFNGVPATGVAVLAASRVRATVPAGAKTGKVTLANSQGTATSPGVFTVVPSSPAS